MSVKLNIQDEMGPLSMSSRVEGDKIVVTVEYDYRVSATRLPDDWRGPCIEVLQRDPLLYFVHGGKPRAALTALRAARTT